MKKYKLSNQRRNILGKRGAKAFQEAAQELQAKRHFKLGLYCVLTMMSAAGVGSFYLIRWLVS